jgi:ABC-2 type transport system ATP-binding protein
MATRCRVVTAAVIAPVVTGDRQLVGAHLGPGAMNPRHTVRLHLCWLSALAEIDASRVGEVLGDTGLFAHQSDRIGALSAHGNASRSRSS